MPDMDDAALRARILAVIEDTGAFEQLIRDEIRRAVLADPRYQALVAEAEAEAERVLHGDPTAESPRGVIDA